MEISTEVSVEATFMEASVEATFMEASVEALEGTYFRGSSGSFHRSFRHVEAYVEISIEATSMDFTKPSVEASGTSMEACKAINNTLPLRHLHGSFNSFHGTRGNSGRNLRGLSPKRNNRAGDRKTFMYFTLTYFHVVRFHGIES